MNETVKAMERGDASRETLRKGLTLRGADQEALFALARVRRDAAFGGGAVEVRSVIEISNICKQRCNYCAIGSGSCEGQYLIEVAEFIERIELLSRVGRRVVLVQSGENDDQDFVDHVAACVGAAKQSHPDMVLLLCLGNMARAQYARLREAGADRYILKFETSNPELYHKLKPRDTLDNRLRCLKDLVELGYRVGSGNMVGLPGQTIEDMVTDILTLGFLDLAMSSCTPFIPGIETIYRDEPMGDVDLALNTMALVRILYPNRLIPTTSSLEKARPDGQYLGLMAGANTVTIHDGTPPERKDLFPIYDSKRFSPGEEHLMNAVRRAGMKPVQGALR